MVLVLWVLLGEESSSFELKQSCFYLLIHLCGRCNQSASCSSRYILTANLSSSSSYGVDYIVFVLVRNIVHCV